MGNESRISPWHNRVVMVTGGASAFLGVLVLAGWYTHSPALIQVLPAFVPMQYNTALGFLLCGVGLLSVALGRVRLAAACGAVAGTIGLLTLIEYLFGLDLGIDQLLMTHYITVETSHPGRMAPNTALCFSLAATALLIRGGLAPFRRRPLVLGGLGALTLVLGVVAFIGYLTGASTAYGWGYLTRMAVHTAAGVVALGIGILVVAYREGVLAKSESADLSTRPRRMVFVVSTMIMAVVTFTVALNVVREVHYAAVEQKRADLLTLVMNWAETIGALGQLGTTRSQQDDPGSAEAATLRQVTAAHERVGGLSGNSEFVLAKREGNQIVFLLSHQLKSDREHPKTVPFDSDRAEPMRRALLGQSGTLIGLDYAGEVVLAAYTPFGQYGWGLVRKTDMAEINAPFERAFLLACGVGLVIVVLGALAFLFMVDPMIRGLAERTAERKQAEEALRESEAKFRTLYESSSDAVMLLDAQGFFGCNPATLAMFGCATQEEFDSKHPADLSPPTQPDGTDSMTLANERIATAMKEGSLRFEWMHRRTSGEDFPADIALTAMKLGGRRVLQALVRDITDRKRAEEELRESRDYLQDVTSSMWDAVFSVKMPERTIEWASDSFGLLGYDSQEYIGRTTEFVYPSTSDYTAFGEILREAIADGKNVLHAEQTLKRKDGTLFPAAITTTVTRKQGEVVRATSVVRDITERKRTEEELAEHREHLEERVRDRTEELRKTVNLMAGRENRMVELKRAIKNLRAQLEEAGMTPVSEE